MKKNIRKLARLIPRSFREQLKNFFILGFEYGQFKTIKKLECIDKTGNPIPWYTYPAIEYLNSLDFTEKNVFEYGSGNSTLWWIERALNVVSVEHDPKWFEKINSKIQSNKKKAKLSLQQNKEDYINFIKQQDLVFDVVIIDGLWRRACAQVIGEKLNFSDGFIIILDNSDWYPKTVEYIRKEFDTIQVDFHGFGPINSYTWTTTIFLSRNCNFKFKERINYSIFPIKQVAEDDEG